MEFLFVTHRFEITKKYHSFRSFYMVLLRPVSERRGDRNDDNSDGDSSSSGSSIDSDSDGTNKLSSDSDDDSDSSEGGLVAPTVSVKGSKAKNQLEKRIMCYAAKETHVLSRTADKLLDLKKDKLIEEVRKMNHATRYWLAVKFCRMNKNDFQQKKLPKKISQRQVCKLLGVTYPSIYQFLQRKVNETDSVSGLMRRYRYLSPAELNPTLNETHIRKYASNFKQLLKAGYFGERD